MILILIAVTSIFGGWLLSSLFNPTYLFDYGMHSYMFLIGMYALIIFIVLVGMIRVGEEDAK